MGRVSPGPWVGGRASISRARGRIASFVTNLHGMEFSPMHMEEGLILIPLSLGSGKSTDGTLAQSLQMAS